MRVGLPAFERRRCRRAETRAARPAARPSARPCVDSSAGRTIVGVSIVSVRAMAPASASRRSMISRAAGVQSRVGRDQHVRRDERPRFACRTRRARSESPTAARRSPPRRRRCRRRRTAAAATTRAFRATAIRRTNLIRLNLHTCSTTRPSRRTSRASAIAASSASCVTSTIVVPRARWIVAQQLHDVTAVGGVEIAGRLVGQHDRRIVGQRARERDALLLAAGQLRRIVMRAPGQPHFLEQRVGPRAGHRRRRQSPSAPRRSRTPSATE